MPLPYDNVECAENKAHLNALIKLAQGSTAEECDKAFWELAEVIGGRQKKEEFAQSTSITTSSLLLSIT
eukprot:42476-Eustigmatos_ZCMA.PRE.1